MAGDPLRHVERLHLVELVACMACRQRLPGLLHVVPVPVLA